MTQTNIDILDILIVLAKRKKFIVITTFIVTVAVIIYSLLATQYWKSSVSFLTIGQAQAYSNIPQSILGGFGSSILGIDAGGDALNFINIIKSRNFSEKIIREFDLIEYFEIDEADSLAAMQLAVKNLHQEMLSVALDIDTGMITISIETKNRYLSSEIANSYFSMLEDYFLDTKMSKGRERRIFLEQRVEEFGSNFSKLTKEIEEFQRANKIIEIEAQKESLVNIYSNLVARKIEAEIELEYAKKFASEGASAVRGFQERVNIINQAINKIESGDIDIKPEYVINIAEIPELNSQYLQLNLNLEIQKKVVEFLYPQYEKAKLDELSDISTFELIDGAVPAGLRSKPRRARMVVIAFAVALFISSLLAYTYEILAQTDRKEKVDKIIKEFSRFK